MFRCRNTRGQGYIAETLFAIIIISGVLFTASSAFTQPSRITDVEDRKQMQQLEADLSSVVQKSIDDGTLKRDLLNYREDINTTGNSDDFEDKYARGDSYQNQDGLYLSYPDSKMGDRLEEFETRNRRVNDINVGLSIEATPAVDHTDPETGPHFDTQKPDGLPFVSKGSAGERMVIMKRTIVLHGSDRLQAPPSYYTHQSTQSLNVSQSSLMQLHELDEDNSFPNEIIPPAKELDNIGEDDIYNVVEVRVVAWF